MGASGTNLPKAGQRDKTSESGIVPPKAGRLECMPYMDAPWITPEIRRNPRVYRKWVKRGRNANDHGNVRKIQNSTNKLILEAKQSYFEKFGHRLSDPQTGQNYFWTASRTTRNPDRTSNSRFTVKKASRPIVVFSIFSERLDQFG